MRGIPDPGAPSGYFSVLARNAAPSNAPAAADDWARDIWWQTTDPAGESS